MLATSNSAISVSVLPGFARLAEVSFGVNYHMVVAKGETRLRLCIHMSRAPSQDRLIISHDNYLATRLRSAARYEKAAHGRRLGPDRTASPAAYRRARLVLLLAVHDGLQAGASARDLAFGLVFARHQPLAGAAWKGSDERRHTLRLIAEARKMVNGGYRNLLLHH